MRKFICLILSFVLATSICCPIFAANESIDVFVDNQRIIFDVKPILIGGRTMVPLRAIFEAIGATVIWDEETQTVTSYNELYMVKATIGSNTMNINGKNRNIDVAPIVVNDKTLVPARFVAEAFGCDVQWDEKALRVMITTKPIDYSKVENDINDTDADIVPNVTVPDTIYETASSKYYPGTSVPDYTYVTGIDKKQAPWYSDNGACVIYIYKNTKIGEYSEIVDYMTYLSNNGWSEFKGEKDFNSVSWYYAKNDKLIGVVFKAEHDEVWIVVGY